LREQRKDSPDAFPSRRRYREPDRWRSALQVDEDGTFECDNHEHFGPLKQLGCHGEGEHVHRGPVKAEEPPAIPEGYASEEVVRALIEENEDQKVAIGKLNGDVEKLRGELSSRSWSKPSCASASRS
jgi:hypothetical protein